MGGEGEERVRAKRGKRVRVVRVGGSIFEFGRGCFLEGGFVRVMESRVLD